MSPSVVSSKAISSTRAMRKDMTEGEKKLWAQLRHFKRDHGLHVRKQTPIGPYCADFAIHSKSLIIELDGEQHFTPEGIIHDGKRDLWFKQHGYRVLRFTTGDLLENMEGILEKILMEVGKA